MFDVTPCSRVGISQSTRRHASECFNIKPHGLYKLFSTFLLSNFASNVHSRINKSFLIRLVYNSSTIRCDNKADCYDCQYPRSSESIETWISTEQLADNIYMCQQKSDHVNNVLQIC